MNRHTSSSLLFSLSILALSSGCASATDANESSEDVITGSLMPGRATTSASFEVDLSQLGAEDKSLILCVVDHFKEPSGWKACEAESKASLVAHAFSPAFSLDQYIDARSLLLDGANVEVSPSESENRLAMDQVQQLMTNLSKPDLELFDVSFTKITKHTADGRVIGLHQDFLGVERSGDSTVQRVSADVLKVSSERRTDFTIRNVGSAVGVAATSHTLLLAKPSKVTIKWDPRAEVHPDYVRGRFQGIYSSKQITPVQLRFEALQPR